MSKFDFAIVGAGIAGASLAARLAPHAKVLLLEREPQPGYHSTGRSAALYSALYGNAPIRALTRASRAFFDAPPAGFAEHPLLSPRGVLYAGDAHSAASIEQMGHSALAQSISTAEALARVPVLREAQAKHCAYEPEACDIDVHALHQGFLRLARRGGAQLVCAAPVRAACAGSSWFIVAGGEEYEANVLVNAAGAWADELAVLAGASAQGLSPLLRTALHVDAPANCDIRTWPAVIAADESFYFKPDAGLLLASPADETPSAPCDAQPDDLEVAQCVDRIERATTLNVTRVRRAWAGLRTFAPDRTPVAGYDGTCPRFFWLAGQGGYGIQTAPALSDAAAALALGQALPDYLLEEGFEPADLAPGRVHNGKNLSLAA